MDVLSGKSAACIVHCLHALIHLPGCFWLAKGRVSLAIDLITLKPVYRGKILQCVKCVVLLPFSPNPTAACTCTEQIVCNAHVYATVGLGTNHTFY